MQEVYSGRDYYDRMVGVVITNQYYTQPAIDLAVKLKILLWDRDYIMGETGGRMILRNMRLLLG